jgi:hypothetical protein
VYDDALLAFGVYFQLMQTVGSFDPFNLPRLGPLIVTLRVPIHIVPKCEASSACENQPAPFKLDNVSNVTPLLSVTKPYNQPRLRVKKLLPAV